jgi:hypothetical protein
MERFYNILRCPDDGGLLERKDKFLKFNRSFPIHRVNVVELLPKAPYPLNEKEVKEEYLRMYHQLFKEEFRWNPSSRGWGDLSLVP